MEPGYIDLRIGVAERDGDNLSVPMHLCCSTYMTEWNSEHKLYRSSLEEPRSAGVSFPRPRPTSEVVPCF